MIHDKIRATQFAEKEFEVQKETKTLLKKAEELERQGKTTEAAELRDKAMKLQQMLEEKKAKM
jgi:hypothetical protein